MSVSQTFAEFVGYQTDEVVGKSIADFYPLKTADDLQNIYTSVLKTGLALYGLETILPDTNGVNYHLSSVIAPFSDANGWTLGLVGVSFDVSSYKIADRSNQDLLLQNRKLTRQFYAAQEAERRHIARELHDELGQWFTAIQAESQVICNFAKENPRIHDSALSISKSTRAVHEVIRGMLRQLRPSLLDELGLEDSLRELLLQWCNKNPDISCEFKLLTTLNGLGDEVNLTVYRVIQESLNNIVNHSGAHSVTIQIQRELKKGTGLPVLAVSITDDGVGFDPLTRHEGIGLLGMRERVIALGGEFKIESMPEMGTEVTAKFF
jgi:PAS domain S-box-containing protein